MTTRKAELHALLATVDAVRAQLAALLERDNEDPNATEDWMPISSATVPVRTLRAAIRRGELDARRVGREYHARRGDIDRWIASRPGTRSRSTDATTDVDTCIRRSLAAGHLRPVARGTGK